MYVGYFDKVTEAITHFIGLFEMASEEARLKQAYYEFKAQQKADEQLPEHETSSAKFDAPHTLEDFDPSVRYIGVRPEIEQITVWSKVSFTPPDIPNLKGPHLYPDGHQIAGTSGSGGMVLPQIEPPGSIVAIINQEIRLSDDDYVGFGGSGLKFTPLPADDTPLSDMRQAAADISPIDDLVLPGTTEDMATFVTTAAERFGSFDPDAHDGADIFSIKGEVLEGTYFNGQLIDEADTPQLKDHVDYLKDHSEDQPGPDGPLDIDTSPESSDFMEGWGNGMVSSSVEVTTGGNTVINNAVVIGESVQAQVMAVMGNQISLNAIVQINGTCDADSVSSAVGGWPFGAGGDADQSFNIAMFKHIDPSADDAPVDPTAGFPAFYVVTEISGDLIIMNWINQYAFMSDNDVCIASSSGVQSVVSTGDNTAYNSVDLNELGNYYDLIIVGGNVYDASIIHQLNLLLDNDTIGALSGFETSGEGSVSTQGNLLWNQAAIINVGTTTSDPLPDGYNTAAANLAGGKHELPQSILDDPAFAGTGMLRVLYISGDIYNLQYIKQTTVVGDSDQVALAMNQVLANPEADWTIATGDNQLVNYATIVDVDPAAKVYVGGDTYSDEVLIQAELVPSTPDLGAQNPDILVSEAVAFLGDDTEADGTAQQDPHIAPQPADSGSADVMQHMLG
ncbi:type I secretion protein [Aminobacter sp. HY435]|uniref:type I secretion protein n=1 Tax=Aminobacter sp. HY435 TaxID=2970917 RepID=UPI0022B95578|nr:type I secretion protein [Aminobacter sp. HY435]